MSDEIESFNESHEAFHDPRFSRRVVSVTMPIPIVENMFDVVFECGHSPLLFQDTAPTVGGMLFCPDCYKETQ